ncbi:hypothetical protein L3X38_020118 [Prunus dulcis]|uniref:Uncharacterized protein n=1 Tax=Prunus dulcis TaxID=3755 RepID=A0AAD4WCF9_PRUDU|nr:hypothetical protein L3X38_020118 [Prunus dulcis]
MSSRSNPNTITLWAIRFSQKFCCSSGEEGCARCVEVVGDRKLGLQSWADSQIQAVYSIAYAIASASRSLLLTKCCE